MRRAVIALVLALPLTLGTAAASAHNGGSWGWGHGPSGPRAAVAGTVVSVDATAGTIVADAYVVTPPTFSGYPGHRGGGPGRTETATQGGQGWGQQGEAEGALERVPDHYADDARDDSGHDHHELEHEDRD